MPNKPILITGCQRSGTTLLSLILDSHPLVHGIDEMDFKWAKLKEYLGDHAYHSHVSFKLPVFSHLVESFNRLPNAKVLWCIRDPRDVVGSMINLLVPVHPYKAPWSLHPLGAQREIDACSKKLGEYGWPIIDSLMANYQVIQSKAPRDRNQEDSVFLASFCWYLKQELLAAYQQRNIPVKVLFYEKLVRDSETQLRELLDHLGLPWHKDILRHHRLHRGTSIGFTDNTRAIDDKSVAKWKDILGPDDIDIVDGICSDRAKDLGYRA